MRTPRPLLQKTAKKLLGEHQQINVLPVSHQFNQIDAKCINPLVTPAAKFKKEVILSFTYFHSVLKMWCSLKNQQIKSLLCLWVSWIIEACKCVPILSVRSLGTVRSSKMTFI